MSRISSMGHRLYTGEVSFDFVGRWKLWYAVSAVIVLLSLLGLFVRGLDLGLEFRGGAEFQLQTSQASVEKARDAVGRADAGDQIEVVKLGSDRLRIETPEIDEATKVRVQDELAKEFSIDRADVSAQVIGPSWGEDVSDRALRGLAIFLILVVIFMTVYFEWKMALAGIIALAHDLLITVGIYAWSGFAVTPATVIGLLTILGYSLYDTVIVFDKVKENTAPLQGNARMTYSQAANLAVNQTLVRSINTSVIALLPVGAILFVGAGLLHADTLKDLSLALFVGIAAGTYSSIFVATPLAAQFKEREPAMAALRKRVEARSGGGSAGARAAARAGGAGARGAGRPGAGSGATVMTVDPAPDANLDDEAFLDPAYDDADGSLPPPAVDTPAVPVRRTTPRAGAAGPGPRNQPRRPAAKGRPSGKKRR